MTQQNDTNLSMSSLVYTSPVTILTTSHDTNLSTAASLCIAIITGIPVLVNIVYIIVCFRTLRKKFHNLLVLTLCISDCFLGISLSWYIVASLLDSLRADVASCLFQTFAVGYGLVSSYSIILIICLERYAVVQARNFGISKTLDRFKYLAIGGTLALGFMFTIETVLFNRAEETIETCSVPNLYGDRFSFFIQVMIGGITTILLLITLVTVRTSYLIWNLFYKNNKVDSCNIELSNRYKPQTTSRKKIEESELSSETSATTAFSSQYIASGSQTQNADTVQLTSKPWLSLKPCTNNDSEINESVTVINELQNSQRERRTSNIKVQQLIIQMKTERLHDVQHSMAKIHLKRNTRKRPFRFAAWEFRAFATSIIIALTTVLFTGPFIVSYWIDVFTGTLLPMQTRYWLVIPLVMNSIANPFIYAWRIPEIRTELKRVFRC